MLKKKIKFNNKQKMNQNIDSNLKLNFVKNNYDSDFPDNKEDFIPVQHDLNRISNLKDNDLPLEDKLQIQKQITLISMKVHTTHLHTHTRRTFMVF